VLRTRRGSRPTASSIPRVRRLKSHLRELAFFTPWVSIPLSLLGVVLALTFPLVLVTRSAWILAPVGVVLAAVLALVLRRRYRVAILDSSPLGVFYWLQQRD
jgi:O-antigen ligase